MRKDGITILELILVMAIIASLAAIIVPVFQSSAPRIELESEARKLMAEIRDIQQRAISSNTKYSIKFVLATDTLVVTYLDDNNKSQSHHTYTLDKSADLTATSFPDNTLSYNLLGDPSRGGDIIIRNSRNDQYSILVAPLTGKVSLIE